MNKADKEVFQSFAHAQASVTNQMYEHLKQPSFMFCPTEYCSTRAIPTVTNSQYLNTIGEKLLQGIEFMWTGELSVVTDFEKILFQYFYTDLRWCVVPFART